MRCVNTLVWRKLRSIFSVLHLSLTSASTSTVVQTTSLASFGGDNFSEKNYFKINLCWTYSKVVCQLLNALNEVFSKRSLTFFLGLGLLRLCFCKKSIPFSNTIKPMTPVTRSQDKRLHSVYFTITEKTIISALSLILEYLTS